VLHAELLRALGVIWPSSRRVHTAHDLLRSAVTPARTGRGSIDPGSATEHRGWYARGWTFEDEGLDEIGRNAAGGA
jgi:hypothetical protein